MQLEGSKAQKSVSKNPSPIKIVAIKTNHNHIDLEESEEWLKGLRKESSFKPDFERRDYTQLYLC